MSDDLTDYDIAAIADPQWEKATRVHDWRNHVPKEIQDLWVTFTEPQKRALYRWTDRLAGDEIWE